MSLGVCDTGGAKSQLMVTIKPWKSTGKKLSETPIKMLIAQEMSSTFESNETPPSVVAKLMGLNKLPLHQKVQTSTTNLQKIDSYDCQSGALQDYWQQQEGSCNHLMHLSSNGQIKNHNLQHEVCHENLMEKKLALVHQKFILAKRLATNEKLIQSKEFKDALEVLSSNRDLFLKFLEEPNSLFSKQLKEIQQIISLGSQTKRITVRKLNGSFDSDHEKSMRKNRRACGEEIKRNVARSQPTKIVVLKPSSTLLDDSKTNIASNVVVSLPESRHRSGNLRTDDDIRSREVATEITWQKQKDLSMQKDEYTLIRDLKSYSHQSHSAETSERQEDKKRLPERWALATLNAINHEEQDIKKISCTLGEILAIPELMKEEEVVDRLAISPWVSCGKEQDTSITVTCLPTSRMQESSEGFLKNITSLKSLQDVASHENIRLNEEISCTLSNKSILLKEFPKLKKGKSFKEKVSSLFFSWGNKLVRDKPRFSTSVSSDGRLNAASSSSIKDNNLLKSAHDGIFDDYTSKTSERNLFKFSSPPVSVNRTERHGNVSFKGIRSIEKLWKSKISRENLNQHSPISILETPFQEELSTDRSHSSQHSITGQAEAISRSPLIGSLSRSTYSEKPHSVIIATNSLKLSKLFSKEDKEQEQLDFIQKLISTSNLANESSTTVLAKSHSLDCPLDPILLDDLLEREGEEAKYKEKRSNQKLLFDFASFSLKEIGYCNLVNSYPWSTTTIRARIKTNPTVTEAVLCYLKDCFSEEENFASVENNKQFVDNLVKKEVIRSELVESMWLEMYEFSKEIGEKMLEELFDDALADLIES